MFSSFILPCEITCSFQLSKVHGRLIFWWVFDSQCERFGTCKECSLSPMITLCCRFGYCVPLKVFQSQVISIHAGGSLSFCTNSAMRFRTCCTRVASEKKRNKAQNAHGTHQKRTQAKIRARKYWRNVNLQDADGERPLHKAARFGGAKTARLFFWGLRVTERMGKAVFFCGVEPVFSFVWVALLPQKGMDIESDQCWRLVVDAVYH